MFSIKRILVLLAWVPCLGVGALPTPVQTAVGTNTSAASTVVATFGQGVGSGHLVVLYLEGTAATSTTFSTISDDKGDSFTIIDQQTSGGFRAGFAYLLSATAGATIITANISQSSGTGSSMVAAEYATISAALDKHTSALQTATNALASGNTATTTQNTELLVGWVGVKGTGGSTISAPTPSGNLTQENGNPTAVAALSDGLQTTTQAQASAYTFNGVSAQASGTGIATFTYTATSSGHGQIPATGAGGLRAQATLREHPSRVGSGSSAKATLPSPR
jgi:hypothetical protein